jgi:uncharacterized protein (UPF0210 family)
MTDKSQADLGVLMQPSISGMGKAAKVEGILAKMGSANLNMTDKRAEMTPPVKGMSGCGDGRAKRAELVKKIMKERGVKMIEASKIVKDEGLYKK